MNDKNQREMLSEMTQYDHQAHEFSKNQLENQINRKMMYELVGSNLRGQHILDLCCGDGIDAEYYRTLGAAKVIGLDESKKLLEIAQQKYPEVDFIVSKAEKTPFKDESFDSVFSKYAIMTSTDMAPIFNEIYRVLKPGGTMVILCTHPLRQYAEKGATYRSEVGYANNYFEQKIVDSIIFDGTVHLREPSHTMQEYFTDSILSKFDIQQYREEFDPTAEQINGEIYPGFLILHAVKRPDTCSLDEISILQFIQHKIARLVNKMSVINPLL